MMQISIYFFFGASWTALIYHQKSAVNFHLPEFAEEAEQEIQMLGRQPHTDQLCTPFCCHPVVCKLTVSLFYILNRPTKYDSLDKPVCKMYAHTFQNHKDVPS